MALAAPTVAAWRAASTSCTSHSARGSATAASAAYAACVASLACATQSAAAAWSAATAAIATSALLGRPLLVLLRRARLHVRVVWRARSRLSSIPVLLWSLHGVPRHMQHGADATVSASGTALRGRAWLVS